MNIFKILRERLERIKRIFNRSKEPVQKVNFKDIQNEILQISSELEIVRNDIIPQIHEPRIDKLNKSQEDLIEKKIWLLNVTHLVRDHDNFKKLVYKIELLETNKSLQLQKVYNIKQVQSDLLIRLKKELIDEVKSKDIIAEIKRIKDQKSNKRASELASIKRLQTETFNFSLREIHIKREEERKKIAQIEKERKLEQEYNNCLINSNSFLLSNEFELANEELEKALLFLPDRFVEIKKHQKNINSNKLEYDNRKLEFELIFKEAETKFHDNQLDKALQLFSRAKQLNFNNEICDRRILDTKNKIQRMKQLDEDLKQKDHLKRERKKIYKDDAEGILKFFQENRILEFYHYTDSRNINSIIQHRGLFSINEMREKEIEYIRGSETEEMADYVRLSYSKNHPLMYVSKNEGRIFNIKLLNIDLKIASLSETLFTNVNAARTSSPPIVKFGKDLKFLQDNVKMNIVSQPNHFNLTTEEKPYYQAEIMVKEHLPFEYITNL